MLPRSPSIKEIDFGAYSTHSPSTWTSRVKDLHILAPQIVKLDLTMVQGIRDFSFIVHFAPTLTTLCLNDVPQQPEPRSPLVAIGDCGRLTTLVIRFRNLHSTTHQRSELRADFQETVLNSCNRLSFLDGPVAPSLEHLTLDQFRFSVNRAEDHSIAKAVNLKSLLLPCCGGLRHIFFVRRMRSLRVGHQQCFAGASSV